MIRRFLKMQANEPENKHFNSDFQRLLVALNEWWALVSREIEKNVAQSQSQVFTANGTFTAPHTGWYDVYLHAGGGGSGRVNTISETTASSGAGAGQEISFREHLEKGSTIVFVVGAAGAAGTSSITSGGDGGDTTATVGSTVYTARGGRGSPGVNNTSGSASYGSIGRGGHSVPNTTPSRSAQVIAGGAIEGANGAAANATLPGGACGSFIGGSSETDRAGGGGASSLGAGGDGASENGSGSPGQGFGAGAGGSLRVSAGSADGAVGGAGRVLVSWIG